MTQDLRAAQEDIADHLDAIRLCFRPGAKVMLIVRNPSVPGDTAMCMGNDEWDEAVKAVNDLRARRPEESI